MPEPRSEQNGPINNSEISQSQINLMAAGIKEPTLRAKATADFGVMKKFADAGIYSASDVLSDMRYVVTKGNVFYRDDNLRKINLLGVKGDGLEFLVDKLAESYDWFGEGTFVKKTLTYDDWCHGVDAVVEYNSEDENIGRVALMIDCSNSRHEIQNKIESNRNKMALEAGRQVKYFESQVPGFDFKGGILCIPVVVGIDQSGVNELLDHMRDKRFVAESPVQIAFLLEIKSQLEMYQKMFDAKDWIKYPDPDEVQGELHRISSMVNRALGEKSELAKKDTTRAYLSHDLTFGLITELSDDFGRTIEKTNP